jgi:ribose 5-phosphate isomerase B
MRIAIGADHAGFEMKEQVGKLLRELGHEVDDKGTTSASDSVDYPDFALAVARAVASGAAERGILMCGTGIGMSITANKVAKVRAALCHDHFTARLCREHNDANLLCFGGRTTGPGVAEEMVKTFLETPFSGGRHTRRVEKIRSQEESAP